MMSYTPVAYTTVSTVKRILRSSNNKITIGDEPNDLISTEDVEGYILDTSMYIDGYLKMFILKSKLPLTSTYPEISYAAPRYTAFLIYRDFAQSYRREDLPSGPRGWLKDATDMLNQFVKNINHGMYTELSTSRSRPNWETAEEYFQKNIGVFCVDDMVGNTTGNPITTGDNIGPWSNY